MIFSVGMTGCSTQNKTDSDSNQSSVSENEETNILNKPSAPTTDLSDRLSTPQNSQDNTGIDYNQYLNKVWVVNVNNEKNEFIMNPSFSISKIENGQITGKFNMKLSIPNNFTNYGNLNGTISEDTATCQFDDGFNTKGTLKLVFETNNKIEVTIVEYADKSDAARYTTKEGTSYEYIPLNVNNMYGFVPIKNQTYTVDLNSWGTVNFVAGIKTEDKMKPLAFYLTDKNGNIYYEFYVDPYVNVEIRNILIQDVNKDGLKDIIIVSKGTNPDDISRLDNATILFQDDKGSFTNDRALDEDIKNSGYNKDIKSILNYLSKKF